jgi:hypothetical protein
MALPLPRFSGKAEQPQDEGCEQSDKKQYLEPPGIFRLRVAQRESPPMAFKVTESFFDFHAPCVRSLDEFARAAMMWERSGE